MRWVVVAALGLAGCAGDGGVAQHSSPGAVYIGGDVTIIKQFGADCTIARSGFQTDEDGSAQAGTEAGVAPAEREVQLGRDTASALMRGLAALDTCGPQEGDDFEAPPPDGDG